MPVVCIKLFDWHMNIESISLIVGTPLDLEKELDNNSTGSDSGGSMRRRWELRAQRKRAFIWDKEGRYFRRNIDAWTGGESLYHAMEYASAVLVHKLYYKLPRNFRFMLVYVVSK